MEVGADLPLQSPKRALSPEPLVFHLHPPAMQVTIVTDANDLPAPVAADPPCLPKLDETIESLQAMPPTLDCPHTLSANPQNLGRICGVLWCG